MVNFSTLVDRYEKDGRRFGIYCLQFSPDSRLLATGTIDGKIMVRPLKMIFFY